MIKRYILHIEFHWGYWPKISFKRVPRPGDRVFDGGEWGTLVICRECGGDGLLHLVEPKKFMAAQPEGLFPEGSVMQQVFKNLVRESEASYRQGLLPRVSDHQTPPAIDLNAYPNTASMDEDDSPETIRLDITKSPSDWQVGTKVFTRRSEYVVTLVEHLPVGHYLTLIRKDVFEAKKEVDD